MLVQVEHWQCGCDRLPVQRHGAVESLHNCLGTLRTLPLELAGMRMHVLSEACLQQVGQESIGKVLDQDATALQEGLDSGVAGVFQLRDGIKIFRPDPPEVLAVRHHAMAGFLQGCASPTGWTDAVVPRVDCRTIHICVHLKAQLFQFSHCEVICAALNCCWRRVCCWLEWHRAFRSQVAVPPQDVGRCMQITCRMPADKGNVLCHRCIALYESGTCPPCQIIPCQAVLWRNQRHPTMGDGVVIPCKHIQLRL
mmetsp:Transcript_33252/g.94211  ORF Transcript_33252/g.94211 Transcript_33252/m.94211 type:complete len:253 (-) Transcript_33252:712-1470(-)